MPYNVTVTKVQADKDAIAIVGTPDEEEIALGIAAAIADQKNPEEITARIIFNLDHMIDPRSGSWFDLLATANSMIDDANEANEETSTTAEQFVDQLIHIVRASPEKRGQIETAIRVIGYGAAGPDCIAAAKTELLNVVSPHFPQNP